MGTETRAVVEMGTEVENGNGNKDGNGEGQEEVKKRKIPHKSRRRDVGNGAGLGGKKNKT